MAHYELRPFAPVEAEIVAGWAATGEDREHLVGHSAPLAAADVAVWHLEANWDFTLRRDGDLVAYADLVEDDVEQDVEIQHLLVAPDVRNSGVGRALLLLLCRFLVASRPYPEVWLRAGRLNAAMLACAHAAGFVDAIEMSGPRFLWLKRPLISGL